MKTTLSLIVILSFAMCAFGGNLEPNAPPGSTMKPLDQVEPRIPITSVPYTISTSGSYYLTKNLTATGTAITVSADNVTIDLCGYTLAGPGASSGINYGISMTGGGRKNIEIRNGIITGFGYDGICDSAGSFGYNHRIIGVQSISNGRSGIYLSGLIEMVKDCVAHHNGGSVAGDAYGIRVGGNSTVTGSKVYNNGGSATGIVYGISASSYSTVTGNSLSNNGVSATGIVYGIYAGSGSIITGNTISGTGTIAVGPVSGIYAANNSCTITGNAVYSTNGDGIVSGTFCQISENSVIGNAARGIAAGDNSNISGNVVGSNTSDGINGGDHVTITGNTVTSNGNWGITCTGGYVARNTVSLNNTSSTAGKGGIYAASHSQVKENTLEGNTKNNIYIGGSRSSIEGNVMSGSDYGINFGSTGNVYLNNRASANGTNYNASGNTDGGGNVSF